MLKEQAKYTLEKQLHKKTVDSQVVLERDKPQLQVVWVVVPVKKKSNS
jgi:hypothetical protein